MYYQQQQHQQVYNHFPAYLSYSQHQQQHPLLAAASGSNYAHSHPRGYYSGHDNSYRSPIVVGGGEGGDGGGGEGGQASYFDETPSGYGGSSGVGYDYHVAPAAAQIPKGGSYSHHAAAGTAYGPPSLPPSSRKKKQGGSSTLTALTLLSFFFFVNLLQGCLKDNSETMNPTVMVMTAGVGRNKLNKLAEMSSREQGASPGSSSNVKAFTSGAAIVLRPAHLVGSISPPPSLPILLQAPYSQSSGSSSSKPSKNYNYHNKYTHNYRNVNEQENNNNYHKNNSNYNSDTAEFYETSAYPNHTRYSVLSSEGHYRPPSEHQHQNYHHPAINSEGDSYPWSPGASDSSAKRGQSTWTLTPNRRNNFEEGESLHEADYYEDRRYEY